MNLKVTELALSAIKEMILTDDSSSTIRVNIDGFG